AEDYPSVKTVRAVEPGDVLVGNIRPYFKKIWFADRKGGASNDVITFRADNTTVTPEFLFGILYSDRFFDYVTATSKGTKMPRGDKQAIALYQVGLPDKDVITSVSDVVNPMLEQVSLNEKQNQQLTKLRNLLLPKLLAGDIDLSNIETVMNNA
ncbi:MAG: restriction endonuclease subunit S, partial [Lacticaseibacillus paracasei]|nr:restriction endonuclease subunit S [Lacticaseibacillus paracasei]